MEEMKEMKCNRCKVLLPIHKFSKNRAEKYLKSCDECRAKQKVFRDKYKCEHGRQRSNCKECGGASICEHGRQRNKCKECKGSQICEHRKLRNNCKECGGVSICEHNTMRINCKKCSDPIKVSIKNWISHSREGDKKYSRYDANNFIDKCFLEYLVEDYPNCYYCTIPLQYVEYQDDMATIERVDNSIGHIKSNCVIACRSCNYSRIGDSK